MAGGINGPPILNGPAYEYPSSTLSALRDDLLTMLGFPDPLTGPDSQTQELVYLREALIRRCGFTYVAGANPPNLDELIDGFINEAQQTIFRTVEFDKGSAPFPALMVNDTDPTEIDYTPVFLLSLGLAKAHFKQNDSPAYFEQFSKYLSDRAIRRPPNIVGMCNQWIIQAQKKLYHRYKLLRTEEWWSIPITAGNRFYDVPAISSGALTDLTFVNGGPATITRAAGSWLTDGFRVGHKIKALGADEAGNNNTQWTIDTVTALIITLVSADVVVAESAGASVVINTGNYINLDFRTVTEAWLLDNLAWLPLTGGIDAAQFNISTQTAPTRFELREYFELFPEPQKSYTAYIKGHRGLLPFAADTDITTIDPDVILFKALVWGKRHFKDYESAREFQRELNDWIGTLNSGRFAGLRFVPRGTTPEPIALSYPQTTFPRG